MPARVKILAGFGLLGWTTLTVLLVWLSTVAIGVWVAVPFAFFSLGALAWWLFTYVPQIDWTGMSLWRGPLRQEVALTFDDGPSAWTGPTLAALAQHEAKATFFFLGENSRRHPELVAQARAEGHAIGNHGLSHRKMHKLSVKEIEQEIQKSEKLLAPLSVFQGRKLVRVPHGFKSLRLVRTIDRIGYRLVAWSSGLWDSDRPGGATIAARGIAALRPGAILLLHDGDGNSSEADRSQTVEALPAILEAGQRAGFRFVTIPDLFRDDPCLRSS